MKVTTWLGIALVIVGMVLFALSGWTDGPARVPGGGPIAGALLVIAGVLLMAVGRRGTVGG